jgi:hypothetical protein
MEMILGIMLLQLLLEIMMRLVQLAEAFLAAKGFPALYDNFMTSKCSVS